MYSDNEFASIQQMVERQALQSPDSIAITFQTAKLTYQQLNEQANQLAHYLRALGIKSDSLVGVCVERSPELVIALLAILKAGGAYVPLDCAYPQQRLAQILEDARVSVLLTQSHLLELLRPCQAEVVCLDRDREKFAHNRTDNPVSVTTPDDLAYVIYTSGSTGTPKGVAMPHRPLMNLLTWQLQNSQVPAARTLQFTPISFDVSFQEIFATLSAGGTLVLVSDIIRRNAETLLHYLSEQAIERLFLPFIALKHLAEVAQTQPNLPLSLREVITAGEQLKITAAIGNWFKRMEHCTLCNQYGPSESHVVTAFTLTGSPETWPALPPIGQPIANTQIYLLKPKQRRKDDQVEQVAVGEAGELAIGGVALARGYLNQPELTRVRFVANPFSHEPGARLYRTGDLVRYLPDGNLEFIERIDDQVKIRGVRIELGEIEVALNHHPLVKDAVVVAREDASYEKQLMAYVIAKDSAAAANTQMLTLQLRTFLQQKLPNCMVPALFVFMDTLPLTPSGKVDRRSLPQPSNQRPALEETFVAPRNTIEQQLAAIWSQVLEIEAVGIFDNFFELGGDSLRAIRLVFQTRKAFHVEIPIISLFDAPTIIQFAEIINIYLHSSQPSTHDSNQVAKMINDRLHPSQLTTSDSITVAALEAEADLDPTIAPGSLPVNLVLQPTRIFITGVTGFLGAFLLQELLEQTQAEVYCLVRASDRAAGLQKIQHNLQKYLLWQEDYADKIIPVPGDLSRPNLGLTQSQFSELARSIDVIYHNGASINLIYPYSALREPNVLGTAELLKLATQSRLKPVHFISTLDVCQTSRSFSSNFITEYDDLNANEAIHFDGYTKTKWVSEKMIRIAHSRGLPVAIYRPAMITGHSQTGAANVSDLMNRLIKGFIQLGAAPDFEMMINIAPVDYFSQGAIYLSRQPSSLGKTFNFINPQPLMFRQFIELLNACGYPVQQVTHGQWENLLIQNSETVDGIVPVLTSKVSESSLSYLERCSVGAKLTSCENVLRGLEDTSIVCPPIDKNLLNTYFAFFAHTGFLEANKAVLTP
jgi:amino acid adenylation domain-containing protein/thioester reductase-like protein